MTGHVKQRDNVWRRLRLGDVTMSRAGDIMAEPSSAGIYEIRGERGCWMVYDCRHDGPKPCTPTHTRKEDAESTKRELCEVWKKTHWSRSAESYMYEKLSELVHCVPADVWKSQATDWGTQQEPHAFELAVPAIEERFGMTLSMPVDDFAYIHHATEEYIGCSPDGVIGDDGLCEIKCPYNGAKWMEAFDKGLTLPAENRDQVQGSLWVTNRRWYAFIYFDPRVQASGLDPLLVTKVMRDDEYINTTFAPRICAFRDWLREKYQRLVKREELF